MKYIWFVFVMAVLGWGVLQYILDAPLLYAAFCVVVALMAVRQIRLDRHRMGK